jgi:acyl carrier protein
MQDADIEPVLRDILREATANPGLEVQSASALRDIPGWDSVSMVAAILSIEDRFAIEFQSNEFATVGSVGDLAALVRAALGEPAPGKADPGEAAGG